MAISGSDGSIILSTKVDTSGINKGMSSIKGIVGKVGGVIAAAFSVRTLINFGKEAINLASDLQEVQNVVDTAFGSMSYKIEEFSKTAIENFGISRLTAKRTASTYMAMAKGMGIAEDEASDMAITMTGLTADIASFYNMSQERADVILKSVYTGETESLKQLGIVMTEVNLEQFAMSKGITKNIRNMTQQEKTMLRYQFVLEQTKLAQGDFAKTQDSWANQTRILTERWKEMQATFGEAFMAIGTLFLPVINSIVSGLTQIAQMAVVASKAIYKLFTGKELQVGNAEKQVNAISESVENQDALTESVKETAKEQQKLIAGFDEITKIGETQVESPVNILGNETSESIGGTPLTLDTSEFKKTTSEINSTLAAIMAVAGGVLVAIGLVLMFFGQIPWGVGFVIAGAGLLAVSMATLTSSNLATPVSKELIAILAIAGTALLAIGLILLFKGVWKWGIGFIVAGASALGVAIVAVKSGNAEKGAEDMLLNIMLIAGSAMLALGIILVLVGQITPLSIGLIVAGAGALGGAVALNPQAVKDKISNFFKENAALIVGVSLALLVLGIILCFAPGFLALGVGLIVAGAAGLAIEAALNWNGLKEKISNAFNAVVGWVKTWGLLALGIILVASGVGIPIGLALIKKGAQNLTMAENPTWNAIVNGVKNAWDSVKNFWNIYIARYFTWEWWSNLAKSAGNGLISGFEGAVNKVISLVENMINDVVSALNLLSINLGGKVLGFNLDYVNLDRISIPRLAQGAVIPPNSEFLAVLGDQKSGTNIETPLSTMVEAFNKALDYRGSTNQQINVVCYLDGDVVYKNVINHNKKYVQSMGVNPLAI